VESKKKYMAIMIFIINEISAHLCFFLPCHANVFALLKFAHIAEIETVQIQINHFNRFMKLSVIFRRGAASWTPDKISLLWKETSLQRLGGGGCRKVFGREASFI
jgi:hypothetical protein